MPTLPANPAMGLGPIILSDASQSSIQTESSGSPNGFTDRWAEIDIDDQRGDGKSMVIESVEVSRAAILAIYDRGGKLLVSAQISPRSQPVSVKFDTPLTKSSELLAKLFLDNGDGVFDPSYDLPIYDDESELAEEDFNYRLQG